jgi:hypothetical protein
MDTLATPDYWHIALRVLIVLTSSAIGLILGSFIHYAFFEETLIYRGSPASFRLGMFLFICSIGIFLMTVYSLYLNLSSPILDSLLGMLLTKLVWNLGDSYRYAGRLYEALRTLDSDSSSAKEYLARAGSYRQIQDLRSVAQTMFVRGSLPLEKLDLLIDEVTGNDE